MIRAAYLVMVFAAACGGDIAVTDAGSDAASPGTDAGATDGGLDAPPGLQCGNTTCPNGGLCASVQGTTTCGCVDPSDCPKPANCDDAKVIFEEQFPQCVNTAKCTETDGGFYVTCN